MAPKIKTLAFHVSQSEQVAKDFSEYAVCDEICRRIMKRLDTYAVNTVLLHEVGGSTMRDRKEWCIENEVALILCIGMKYDIYEEFSVVTAYETMFYDHTWRYTPVQLAQNVAEALGTPDDYMGDQTRDTLCNIQNIKGLKLELGNAAYNSALQADLDIFCEVIADAVAVWCAKEMFLAYKKDDDGEDEMRYYVRYWWWDRNNEVLWTTIYDYAKRRADYELGLKVYNQFGIEVYNSEYTKITASELPVSIIEGATISRNGCPMLDNLDHPTITYILNLGTTVAIIGERRGDYRRVRVKINGRDEVGYVKIPFLQYNMKEVSL